MLPNRLRKFRPALWVIGIASLAWWGWARIAGSPAWLKEIGLLKWLHDLSPLDTWLGVHANFLVVIVALFQEKIKGWFSRARLELEFKPESPFCCMVPVSLRGGTQITAHHVRILVRNTGSAPAQHVEVHAAALFDSAGRRVPWFLPMNLTWADDPQPQGYPAPGFKERLLPGTARMCNVLNVLKADGFYPLESIMHKPRDFQSGPAAKLYTHTDPNSFSNLLFPGTYHLEIEMSAGNVRLTRHQIRIRLVSWHDDPAAMFSDSGLTVEVSDRS